MTNGDRIRQMSDSELSKFIVDSITCKTCRIKDYCDKYARYNKSCLMTIQSWLCEDRAKVEECNKCLWATRDGGCSSWNCNFISKDEAFEAWKQVKDSGEDKKDDR